MNNIKNKKKVPREKYSLGSFVSNNSGKINQVLNTASQINEPSGIISGAATGASLGSIFPGGTIVGAGLGAVTSLVTGLFGRNKRKKEEQRRRDLQSKNEHNAFSEDYLSNIDIDNQNELGVYEDGGDVFPNIINIEKGELQIDPNTGKILREYNNINPETGGKYEEHNYEGEESPHNMVTAEEGTFIITKETAKKYKESVDNNDKLTQETIVQNIRNKKRNLSKVYADGGKVTLDPLKNSKLNIDFNNFNIPNTLNNNLGTRIGTPNLSNSKSNVLDNIGGVLENANQFIPGAFNMVKGLQKTNELPYTRLGMNVSNRQKLLSEMPSEVSANPALNNIRANRYNINREIDRNTSDPNVRRALKTASSSDSIRAENEAYYQNQILNNQIRSQRFNLLSSLNESDDRRNMFNIQNLNNINQINRQMSTAKEQQFNTGLSQTSRAIQNRVDTRNKRNMENKMIDIMREIFPEGGFLFDKWSKGGINGNK